MIIGLKLNLIRSINKGKKSAAAYLDLIINKEK